jgi:hypothetical protein
MDASHHVKGKQHSVSALLSSAYRTDQACIQLTR